MTAVSAVSLVKGFHSLNVCVLSSDRKKQTKVTDVTLTSPTILSLTI